MEKMPPSEVKAKSENEMFKEMLPFVIYAAIPLLITFSIAYFLGSTNQSM